MSRWWRKQTKMSLERLKHKLLYRVTSCWLYIVEVHKLCCRKAKHVPFRKRNILKPSILGVIYILVFWYVSRSVRFDLKPTRHLMLVVKVDDMSSIVMSFAMQGHLEMEDGFWNSVPYVNLMCMYILKYIYIFFTYTTYTNIYIQHTHIYTSNGLWSGNLTPKNIAWQFRLRMWLRDHSLRVYSQYTLDSKSQRLLQEYPWLLNIVNT